jgi:hypothetical protein
MLDGGRLTTMAEGLTFPTAMTFGPGGDLYVSNRGYGVGPAPGQGEIVRIALPSGTPATRPPSEGCALLNDDRFDIRAVGFFVATRSFFAGETLTMTADKPAADPSALRLLVDIVEVDTSPFPGTVTYTFPADSDSFLQWGSDDFQSATWTVSCDPAPVRSI